MDLETYLRVNKIPFVVIYFEGDLDGRQLMIPINAGSQFMYETVKTISADEARTPEGKKLEPVVDLTGLTGRQRHTAKNKYKLSQYQRQYRQRKMNQSGE